MTNEVTCLFATITLTRMNVFLLPKAMLSVSWSMEHFYQSYTVHAIHYSYHSKAQRIFVLPINL